MSLRPTGEGEVDRWFHKHKWFEPANEAEHEASCEGRSYNGVESWNLTDPCANCDAGFMEHHNGRCPK